MAQKEGEVYRLSDPQCGCEIKGIKAPGFLTAVSTGVASRSHYLWAGAGYTRFAEADGDRRPDMLSYSLVWGYRHPPS